MKKKILSFVLAICLILPFGIMLSGCEMKENNNTTQIGQIQQTKVLTVEDAFNLYNLALIQYEMGYKDTRTNLKITSHNSSNVYKFYTTTDGTQVVLEDDVLYWQEGYNVFSYNITKNIKLKTPYSHIKELNYLGFFNVKNACNEENLLSYDIDDNGNYVFIFAEENTDENAVYYTICEHVISLDLKFISTYEEYLYYTKDNSLAPQNDTVTYKFEYNTITEDEILPILTTAKQASVQ